MTSHNHLDDCLRWRAVGTRDAGQSQVEVDRWLQVARNMSPAYGIKGTIPGLTAKLARDLAAVAGRSFMQTVYRSLPETGLYTQCSVQFICLTAFSKKD
ncbi:hypothetical protein TNCV_2597361 [Trichonephila clavipes]|nr:hypothetical protein TNCV_2597361 [Trichonephila clavipes]